MSWPTGKWLATPSRISPLMLRMRKRKTSIADPSTPHRWKKCNVDRTLGTGVCSLFGGLTMYIQAGDEHFFHGVLSQLFGVSVANSTVSLLFGHWSPLQCQGTGLPIFL